MADEEFKDLEDLENELEDFTTNKDYRDIRDDIIPKFFNPRINPSTGKRYDYYKFQRQIIAASLEAEGKGPIVDEDGNCVYSRVAYNANPTGIGKTLIGLALACYDVSPSKVPDNYLSTSLNFIKLKPAKRENINTTIYIADSGIMRDTWIEDCDKFYPELPRYLYQGEVDFRSRFVDTNPEFTKAQSNFVKLSQLIPSGFNYYNTGASKEDVDRIFKQNGFEEFLDEHGDPRTQKFLEDKIKKDFHTINVNFFVEAVAGVMRQVKAFFCPKNFLFSLVPFFTKYTIGRAIFDEPQNTVYENQDQFRDYLPDQRLNELKRKGMGKMLPFYEESPFRFIWLFSATPHLIKSNDDGHYFNKWISKNDYVLNDYIRAIRSKPFFPKLIERYVVKFPYKYILESRPGYNLLRNDFKLKCLISKRVDALRGTLGDDIDQMLENDDFDGVVRKLGGSNINQIFSLAIGKLRDDIFKREEEIRGFNPRTNKTIRENAQVALEEMKRNLATLEYRISELGTADDVCNICLDNLDYHTTDNSKVCCMHDDKYKTQEAGHVSICGSKYHAECIGASLRVKHECPNCRRKIDNFGEDFRVITSIDQTVKIDPNVPLFYNDPENLYSSKLDALKDSLKYMKRTNSEGVERWYLRTKVLLFVECKSDSDILMKIIRICQDAGYNVRLPFVPNNVYNQQTGKKTTAKSALNAAYPPVTNQYGTMQVTFPKDTKAKIQAEINEFKIDTRRYVWIFRSGKESAGLNFPFVDTIIEYSRFKSHKQIIGRALRINREIPVDLFRLFYTTDEELTETEEA